MISHLDTVFPPEEEERNDFHWQVEGDRIFGPGTNDIKGGTVMMWLGAQGASGARARRVCGDDVEALSEFIRGNVFAGLWRCLPRALRYATHSRALVFESEGRLGTEHLMVVARKGRATWRVTATGRGAHAGGKHSAGRQRHRATWAACSRASPR